MFTGRNLVDFAVAVLEGLLAAKKCTDFGEEVAILVVSIEHVFWIIFAVAFRKSTKSIIEKVFDGSFGLAVFSNEETAHENHFDASVTIGRGNELAISRARGVRF